MVSSEEKRKFIEDMIKMSYKKVQPLELQLQLHELLLRDTNGGKLYKYRSFDKEGFSLKNLQDGTLHCSKADVFNDPFDCKIGVTFQSLYAAKYGAESDAVSELLEKYIKVLHSEIQIEECSVDEQRVIRKILGNKIINDFIDNKDNKADTQEEVALLLKSNAYVIIELMQIVLSDEVFKESLGISANMLSRMIENISQEGMLLISGDNVNFEDYARANGIMDDTDEVGLTMLLSQKLYPEHNGTVADAQRALNEMDCRLAEKMNSLFSLGVYAQATKIGLCGHIMRIVIKDSVLNMTLAKPKKRFYQNCFCR